MSSPVNYASFRGFINMLGNNTINWHKKYEWSFFGFTGSLAHNVSGYWHICAVIQTSLNI
jgi:hypothetical protein